jgi:hypothetical protein
MLIIIFDFSNDGGYNEIKFIPLFFPYEYSAVCKATTVILEICLGFFDDLFVIWMIFGVYSI